MTAATLPVTMIVTGFNQEDLIDAAIEGALAQDYPSLQIILSDDASSDGTYRRMRAAAAAYSGPHRVLATQVPENRGTLGNLYHAAKAATGELVIFAGGDDISYPDRAATIVAHWRATGADAYCSRYDIIDETGSLLERDWRPDDGRLFLRDYFPGRSINPMHGASAACHRSLFDRFPLPAERIRSEDTFFTLMLGLEQGRIEFIERSLVAYRRHAGAITNETAGASDRASIAQRERTQMAFARSQYELLQLFARERLARSPDARPLPELEDDLRLYRLRSNWADAPLRARLSAIPAARRRGHLDWLVPRLPGLGPFSQVKSAAAAWRSR